MIKIKVKFLSRRGITYEKEVEIKLIFKSHENTRILWDDLILQ